MVVPADKQSVCERDRERDKRTTNKATDSGDPMTMQLPVELYTMAKLALTQSVRSERNLPIRLSSTDRELMKISHHI